MRNVVAASTDVALRYLYPTSRLVSMSSYHARAALLHTTEYSTVILTWNETDKLG